MNDDVTTQNESRISSKNVKTKLKEILSRIFTPKRIFFLAFLFTLFISFVILLDQKIMPWYTRHGEALTVPNVTAKRFETAKEILEKHGLKVVKGGEKYDSELPFGYVVSQNPRANRKVKRGRRVYLTTSLGEREIEVPNLIGLSETNAEESLKSLGLRLGEREYEYVPNEPPEVVISQSKAPKSLVRAGTTIDITVSLGQVQENVIVPSVLGKTLEAAKREIQKAGLTLGNVRYQVHNDFLPNTVIDQSISDGQQVSRGETIDLVVTTVTKP
ncbi:MAG: PASTA domain-containing protein [bacterium]